MAMNTFQFTLQPKNPFSRSTFWGRQRELRTIYGRLLSVPPQSSAIIGETFSGKTLLLQHLSETTNTTLLDDQGKEHTFTSVYLDCSLSVDVVPSDYASAQFWWKLYTATCDRLQPGQPYKLSEPEIGTKQVDLVNDTYEIKTTLEELVLEHPNPVVFVFDNFEIVARLPLRNSEWLRSLARSNCSYIVASRYLLYLLYQYTRESWANPSPLYNLFSDPIYLGLMTEFEVKTYLSLAKQVAEELGSIWDEQDLHFIRSYCGCHAELIRIGCRHLFEFRWRATKTLPTDEDELKDTFITESIASDARTICNQLWQGLADPELRDEPRIDDAPREERTRWLSLHQKTLIAIAHQQTPTDKKLLFVLEQRGLIERINGKWQVFAEVMCQFVLNKENAYTLDGQAKEYALNNLSLPVIRQTNTSVTSHGAVSFTYLEGKVYNYLASHVGQVCHRDDIMQAVWDEDNVPSNTALQKIIERIRDKIEPDVDNPRYLIAIRGQGYMLREYPID